MQELHTLNFHFPAILSYWNNCKINCSHKKAASNSFMTAPVYELHEHIRPTGKMFKCWCLNFVAINKRKLKIDLGDGNTANVQADNATWKSDSLTR